MQTSSNFHLVFNSFIHSYEIYYTFKMKVGNENWHGYQNVIIHVQCVALTGGIKVT